MQEFCCSEPIDHLPNRDMQDAILLDMACLMAQLPSSNALDGCVCSPGLVLKSVCLLYLRLLKVTRLRQKLSRWWCPCRHAHCFEGLFLLEFRAPFPPLLSRWSCCRGSRRISHQPTGIFDSTGLLHNLYQVLVSIYVTFFINRCLQGFGLSLSTNLKTKKTVREALTSSLVLNQ